MQRLQGTEQTATKKNAKHNIHKQDIHTDSSSIDRIAYDMLCLASIGINNSTKNKPDEKCLEHYPEGLLSISRNAADVGQ